MLVADTRCDVTAASTIGAHDALTPGRRVPAPPCPSEAPRPGQHRVSHDPWSTRPAAADGTAVGVTGGPHAGDADRAALCGGSPAGGLPWLGFPYADRFEINRQLPEHGTPRGRSLGDARDMAKEEDATWETGKCSGTMYWRRPRSLPVLNEAFAKFAT